MTKRSIERQPKWVREFIGKLERQLADLRAELERCRQVHALTADGRDWFTLGQANEYVATLKTPCTLFVPADGDVARVASLSRGDCLLVARAPKKVSKA